MHEDPSPQKNEVSTSAPLPIPYTAEEVGRTFADLLRTFDDAADMDELGISRLRCLKRALIKRHLTAIRIALWHVALGKSFPKDASTFFKHFIATHLPLSVNSRRAKKLRDLVEWYDTLVGEKKDTDFTQVADALVKALGSKHDDGRRQQLKLSLRIRSTYELIFEKLI